VKTRSWQRAAGAPFSTFEYIAENTNGEVGPSTPRTGRAALPPLDLACSVETEARLPEIAGALSLALARTFKIIDPDFKNPQSERWERSFRIFDLLL
jgi:Domain of unknown function (DUF1931)